MEISSWCFIISGILAVSVLLFHYGPDPVQKIIKYIIDFFVGN